MIITVDRIHSDNRATLSTVSVNDRFICFGLEDAHRFNKLPSQTRIRAGLYRIKLRTHGKLYERYSSRHQWHKGMLEIIDVPEFTDVLIHPGNTHNDTEGCLLLGATAATSDTPLLYQSQDAYKNFYLSVLESAQQGELSINFINRDKRHV